MRRLMRGVTLMEMLIVVLIIGILTTIAYPNYRDYVARAKRNEAKAALLQIAARQEGFYLQNNTYTTNMTNLGFAVPGNFTTSSGAYLVSVTSADASAFAAIAAYQVGDNEADKCASFTIDGQGVKASSPETDCWTNTRR